MMGHGKVLARCKTWLADFLELPLAWLDAAARAIDEGPMLSIRA